MEPIVTEEKLTPVAKDTDKKIEHFDDVKEKLKNLPTPVSKEIIEANKFNDQFVVMQGKSKSLDPIVAEIREAKKNPASINRALEKVLEVVMIVEEVFEIIEVLEEIIEVVKPRCESHPEKAKDVNDKEKEVEKHKKRVNVILKLVKDEEKKIIEQQQDNQALDEQIKDLLKWLPTVEKELVKQTPVSANYDILKKQQEEHQVKYILTVAKQPVTVFTVF